MSSRSVSVLVALSALTLLPLICLAQGTAFTYQGILTENGAPFTGSAEIQTTLWDADAGGNIVAVASPSQAIVAVTNGLFTLHLDFGASALSTAGGRWLQLEVRTSIGPFTLLTPRQALRPTPYSITAANLSGTLPATQLTGTLPNSLLSASVSLLGTSISSDEIVDGSIVNADISPSAAIADTKLASLVTPGKVGNSATTATSANTSGTIVARDSNGSFAAGTITAGNFSGGGENLTGLNASQLTAGTVPDARLSGNVARTGDVWLRGGNAGTDPAVDFLGTKDSAALVLTANNRSVLRLEASTNGTRLIGGIGNSLHASSTNSSILGGRGGVIETGAPESAIVGGQNNVIRADQRAGFIGGGARNEIQLDNQYAVIVGGRDNRIGTNTVISLVVGGGENRIASNVDGGLMVGGFRNNIRGSTNSSAREIAPTLLGGSDNEIGLSSNFATVLGGDNNRIGNFCGGSTILGGTNNMIADNAHHSLAAGRRARVNHPGSFVWSDASSTTLVASTADNSVTMRAAGGYRLFSNSGVTTGVSLAAGGGSWTSLSDRNAKENLAAVDTQEVLHRLTTLPLSTWNYRTQPSSVRHIGPMAQDFNAAFGVGESDTGITTIDADGVALAAIQGLNEKLEAKNSALEKELSALKQLVNTLAERLDNVPR